MSMTDPLMETGIFCMMRSALSTLTVSGLYLNFMSPSIAAGMSLYLAFIFVRFRCPSACNASNLPVIFVSDETSPERLMSFKSANRAASFMIAPVPVLSRDMAIFICGDV